MYRPKRLRLSEKAVLEAEYGGTQIPREVHERAPRDRTARESTLAADGDERIGKVGGCHQIEILIGTLCEIPRIGRIEMIEAIRVWDGDDTAQEAEAVAKTHREKGKHNHSGFEKMPIAIQGLKLFSCIYSNLTGLTSPARIAIQRHPRSFAYSPASLS
jgi:hypothetical protein